MSKPGKQKARAHHVGAADGEIVILSNTPTPHVCVRKNCIKVKFQSRHTARSYTYRLCDECPPDKVKTVIDNVLATDEMYFTKRINLALITTSGASTGKKYDPHLPRDFDRICDAIKINSGESDNMTFAIVRGKFPWKFWFIGGLYITITAIVTGVGFGINHAGAQGAFYGLLGNVFSTLIMILMVLCYYY